MGEVLEFFQSDIVGQFLNPRRRLFWGYLISALIIAILWLCIIKKKKILTKAAVYKQQTVKKSKPYMGVTDYGADSDRANTD